MSDLADTSSDIKKLVEEFDEKYKLITQLIIDKIYNYYKRDLPMLVQKYVKETLKILEGSKYEITIKGDWDFNFNSMLYLINKYGIIKSSEMPNELRVDYSDQRIRSAIKLECIYRSFHKDKV